MGQINNSKLNKHVIPLPNIFTGYIFLTQLEVGLRWVLALSEIAFLCTF